MDVQRGAIFLKISEEIKWQKKRKILDVKPLLLVRKCESVVFAVELNEMFFERTNNKDLWCVPVVLGSWKS